MNNSVKKIILVILIGIVSIVLLGTIFGTIDYIRAKNNNKPIFAYKRNYLNSHTSFKIIQYHGFGYKIIVCDKCIDDKVTFMPFGIGTYAWFIGNESDIDFKITIKERDRKTDDIILKELANSYMDQDDKISSKIYSYGLDEIKITINGITYLLQEALEQNKIMISDIMAQLNIEDVMYDGGTAIYRDSNEKQIADGNLTIIKCNSIISIGNFNKDIYIGNKELVMEENFCR